MMEAASEIQGLGDTKMTHKSVLPKPQGKEIQEQTDCGLNQNMTRSKHWLCARPTSVLLTTARGRRLRAPFDK